MEKTTRRKREMSLTPLVLQFEPDLPCDNGAWSDTLNDWTRRSAA